MPSGFSPPVESRIPLFWWGLRGIPGRFAVLDGSAHVSLHVDGIKDAVAKTDRLTQIGLRAGLDATCLIGSLLPLAPLAATAVNAVSALKDVDAVEADTTRPSRADRQFSITPLAPRLAALYQWAGV